jgi:hypothetical protein
VTFDWESDLTLDGEIIPLEGYQRWSNPYIEAEFGSMRYIIEHKGLKLELDFERTKRLVID